MEPKGVNDWQEEIRPKEILWTRKCMGQDFPIKPNMFSDFLNEIYNHSIEIYDYPSELKIAKVIP